MCSMHTVLWTDAKWVKCEMHQLVSAADVKKQYRKACLAVHPDKVCFVFVAHSIVSLQGTCRLLNEWATNDTLH